MAEERFFEYKSDDSTLKINRSNLLALLPGRYAGFDFVATPNLILNLNHEITGRSYTDENNLESDKFGFVLTKQGVKIYNDANPITIPISSPSSLPRVDTIVLTHIYTTNIGGQAAQISVIQGVESATPNSPALTNPENQIKLGELSLPGPITTLQDAGINYTQENTPNFAGDSKYWTTANFTPSDKVDQTVYDLAIALILDSLALKSNQADVALLDSLNNFSEINDFGKQVRLNSGGDISLATNLDLSSDGNHFRVTATGSATYIKSIKVGTRITLRANNGVTATFVSNGPSPPADHKKIINPESVNFLLGERHTVELIEEADGFYIVNTSQASGGVPISGVIEYFGSVNDIPANWRLCWGGPDVNGIAIPDLRGQFTVGLSDSVGDYDEIGNTGGLEAVILSGDESGLPDHGHTISDPGHTHDVAGRNENGTADGTGVIGNSENSPANYDYTNAAKNNQTGITIDNAASQAASQPHENRPPYVVTGKIIRIS